MEGSDPWRRDSDKDGPKYLRHVKMIRQDPTIREKRVDISEIFAALGQAVFKDMLSDEDKEIMFYWFLMNQVDMEEYHKNQLLAGIQDKTDYGPLLMDFVKFADEHMARGADGKTKPSDSFFEHGPFRHRNIEYYESMRHDKVEELCKDYQIEKPVEGWTLDSRNKVTTDYWDMILNVKDDPELKPFTIGEIQAHGREYFHCGSSEEGVTTNFLDLNFYGGTDIDTMACSPLPGKLQDVSARPGYTRIAATSTEYKTDQNGFMLSSDFSLVNLSQLQADFPFMDERILLTITGPAIGIFHSTDPTVKTMDRVYGFYVVDRQWPAIAKEWIQRSRPSGWPSPELINVAVSHGTYIVPVAHPNSDEEEIEWRYSFSKSELDLMRSITDKQRKCFRLTKRLCSLLFSGFKIFCSYYIKTSFLWMMEQMPAFNWERMTMDQLVDYLFDKIIHYFAHGNLPNYFIQKANLIDHLPRDHVRTVLKMLQQLKLRRSRALPPFVIGDPCLYYINCTVEPPDKTSSLFIPLHEIVKVFQQKIDLASSNSNPPEITEMLDDFRGPNCVEFFLTNLSQFFTPDRIGTNHFYLEVKHDRKTNKPSIKMVATPIKSTPTTS